VRHPSRSGATTTFTYAGQQQQQQQRATRSLPAGVPHRIRIIGQLVLITAIVAGDRSLPQPITGRPLTEWAGPGRALLELSARPAVFFVCSSTMTITITITKMSELFLNFRRVVSVLDSCTVGPGFKSQPRCCRVAVLGKLFTPIVPLFTKQQNW